MDPSISDIPEYAQNAIQEVIWSLMIRGAIVPGVPNALGSSGSGLPFFTITEWGKEGLKTGDYLPMDSAEYLNRLRGEIPNLHRGISLYLSESLRDFQSGCYLSSAVMTRVASEKTLLLLRDAVEAALTASSSNRSSPQVLAKRQSSESTMK